MSADAPAKPPRPVLLALAGALAAVLAALTAGELVWYVLAPELPSPETQLDRSKEDAPATPQAVRPAAEPRLAVAAAAVTVYPGGKNTFGVRVLREQFDTPVTVQFEPVPGLSCAAVTIPAGANVAQAEVVAAPDAKPGAYTLFAVASASTDTHNLRARAPVPVAVPALPPGPARIAVTASPRVGVYQKGKNALAVRVARAGFDDPVTVAFDNLPDGVTIPPVSVPAGKTEAVAELTAAASAKAGTTLARATATAAPNGTPASATAELAVEVLDPSRAPLDVVLVLDCTGSMAKAADMLAQNWPVFGDALTKAKFDARFGLVGFRDTTLGQPLEVAEFRRRDLTTDDPAQVATAVRDTRYGGGGGDGESSLDGLARAADYPLRRNAAARVLVLVTDGPPKRVDRRVRKVDDLVAHFGARGIDQLHVVALPDHRKRFEPLWAGPKGGFFDLKDAVEKDEMGATLAALAKAVISAVPPQPEPKAEASPAAPMTALPEPKAVEVPAPPASADPGEPLLPPLPGAPSAPAPEGKAATAQAPPVAKPQAAQVIGWAAAVACVATMALFFGAMAIPGERPTGAALASGYGGGLVVGLIVGALAFAALDAVGVPLLTRLGAATLFGLVLGLSAAMAEMVFPGAPPFEEVPEPIAPPVSVAKPQAAKPEPPKPLATKSRVLDLDLPVIEAPDAPAKPKAAKPLLDLDLPPVEAPTKPPLLDLDLPPVEAPTKPQAANPAAAGHKPNISGAPKPGDGCPGCRRRISGAPGTRYCMVCDKTF